MKRILFTLFALTTAIAFVGVIAAPAQPPDLAKQNAELKAELAALKQLVAQKNPQPMPKAAVAHGRGYKPNAAKQIQLHAVAKARHDNRIASLPKVLAPKFDCRDMGWAPAMKDQGQCGSCYQFSGAMTCTAGYYKAGLKDQIGTGFAEQYGMDCHDWGGCDGGDENDIIVWAKSNGLPLESDYGPYTASSGQCKLKPTTKLWKIDDWGYCTGDQSQRFPTYQELKNAIATYGPISVAGSAGAGFQEYTSGLFKGNDSSVDHAILCIGWDDTKSPKGSLLLQNQWGTGWGDGGYMWCEYGANAWGTEAMWVKVNGGPTPPPATVAVPSVLTQTYAAASKTLTDAGLMVSPATADPLATVTAQIPVAGTKVPSGSTVTLTLGIGPPPPTGDIVVTIPAGTPAGTYTIGGGSLSADDLAALTQAEDSLAGVLNKFGASGSFYTDPELAAQLKSSIGDKSNGKYAIVAGNRIGHRIFLRMLHHRMSRTFDGQTLLASYRAGALPPGWLQNFGDWLLKNFPQILQDIMAVLKLFGIGEAIVPERPIPVRVAYAPVEYWSKV